MRPRRRGLLAAGWPLALLGGAVALVCVLVLAVPAGTPVARVAPAADARAFQAGNIISDAVFHDTGSMSVADVQAFLSAKGAGCSGSLCMKNYTLSTPNVAGDSFCRGYAGVANEPAAAIIAKVGASCSVNPRVLLVMLQKEMGLVGATYPTQSMYDRAMGYGCADSMNGACSAYYPGLFNQLYYAAAQFQRYGASPRSYNFVPGMTNYIAYNPDPGCGSGPVLIQNQATANLYNYTPYQPNAAALAAGYGTGDGCSAYGNRNFWLFFTDWFGSTQTIGRDLDAPVGTLDSGIGGAGLVTVGGWTYDPNALTTPIGVQVYVDGALAGQLTADVNRPDVGAAFAGVGPNHGYLGTVPAAPGTRNVCTYAINIGAGYSNPLLGCATANVTPPGNPVGNVDVVRLSGRTITVGGWAFDPDVPTSPITVHVYVNGQWGTALTAGEPRPDVGGAYPAAGMAHGWTWSFPAAAPGSYQVCAYGINVGPGTTNPQTGCQQISVPASLWNPFGNLDYLAVAGHSVTLTGWGMDPDTPTTPTAVHLYIDGQWGGAYTANASRPDVGAAFAGYGDNHGFVIPVDVGGGTHQLCLYFINSGYGSANPLMGCRAVSIDPASWNPFGNVDYAGSSGGTATVNGWVIDPDTPTAPVLMHAYVDGVWRSQLSAGDARPDVGAAYPGAGAGHGYSFSLGIGAGRHTVCVYAINVGQGTTNPLMGCRTLVGT